MRHIEVRAFGAPPCNGRVVAIEAPGQRRHHLPLLGRQLPGPHHEMKWRCEACGKEWPREPRLEEAL